MELPDGVVCLVPREKRHLAEGAFALAVPEGVVQGVPEVEEGVVRPQLLYLMGQPEFRLCPYSLLYLI